MTKQPQLLHSLDPPSSDSSLSPINPSPSLSLPSSPTQGQSTVGGELVQLFPLHFSLMKHPDNVVEPKIPVSQVSNSESGSKNTIDELQNIPPSDLDVPIAL